MMMRNFKRPWFLFWLTAMYAVSRCTQLRTEKPVVLSLYLVRMRFFKKLPQSWLVPGLFQFGDWRTPLHLLSGLQSQLSNGVSTAGAHPGLAEWWRSGTFSRFPLPSQSFDSRPTSWLFHCISVFIIDPALTFLFFNSGFPVECSTHVEEVPERHPYFYTSPLNRTLRPPS